MNKIISIKSNAILLAAILLTGTVALSAQSFMIGAHAQPYYYDGEMDTSYNSYESPQYPSYKPDYKPEYPSDNNNYKSKDSKSVSINKIKCINNNVNINGNNAGNISIGNKGQGYLGASSSGGSGYSDEGYSGYNNGHIKKNKGLDCIINNNNNNIAGDGNQTTQPKATLNVTKNVTCTYIFGAVVPELACGLLEDRITENQFLIEVTDDNPIPSQFPGSESGTIVTLGAGNYVVSETPDVAAIQADIDYLVQQFEGQSGGIDYTITPQVSFTGDCTDVNPNNPQSTEATGTIGDGESQTCNIENHFTITAIPW